MFIYKIDINVDTGSWEVGEVCQEWVQEIKICQQNTEKIPLRAKHTLQEVYCHIAHVSLISCHLSCEVICIIAEKLVTEEELSLKVLTNEVVPKVRSKWYLLGIQLNFSVTVTRSWTRLRQTILEIPTTWGAASRCSQSGCHRMLGPLGPR